LRREIAGSFRNGKPLTVAKFILRSSGINNRESILNFADLLSRNFREDDLVARIGQHEFMVLICGSDEYVIQGIQRMAVGRDFEFEYSIASPVDHDDSLKLLNRLDESEIRIA
jgi:GGDEF domain-containing protein